MFIKLINRFLRYYNGNSLFIFIYILYICIAIVLFLYSFFQVDLNLTLINHPIFLELQKPFIEFGYYQRDNSVMAYIGVLLLLFSFYGITLFSIFKEKITSRQAFILIITLSVVLLFSYPASLSHDIFNYMFDAKIVTEYGLNPYTHKALDFPLDPWLRFMHWTYRTYPYGPVWLVVTIPLSYVGMNKFIIILFLFKLLVTVSYLLSSYFIYKILSVLKNKNAILGMMFFALNPLVIIESLVSSHNDTVMMLFAIFAVYLLILKKKIFSIVLWLFSVGVKFSTIYLLPIFVIGYRPFFTFTLSLLAFCVISHKIGLQPWYFLWVMPFAALAYKHISVRIIMFTMPIAFLLRYVPFIETGSWYPSAIPFQYWITVGGIIVSVLLYVLVTVFYKRNKS